MPNRSKPVNNVLLLARGRDRLETLDNVIARIYSFVSYSLGNAIDWKLFQAFSPRCLPPCLLLARGRDRLKTPCAGHHFLTRRIVSYSLGDAIDWKLKRFSSLLKDIFFSYSLGDAIDWKLCYSRDRKGEGCYFSYSLGDAIDWKP